MKTLSQQNERVLLESVQDARAAIDQGSDPTAAVVKVAQDRQLNPHFTEMVCHALNTGSVRHLQETGEGVLGKMASFPLADFKAARQALWPTLVEEQTAKQADVVAAVYSQPVRKVAQSRSLAPREFQVPVSLSNAQEPPRKLDELLRNLEHAEVKAAEAKVDKNRLREHLREQMAVTKHYFSKYAFTRLPWEEVRSNAAVAIGPAAEIALHWVDSQFNLSKQAADRRVLYSVVDLQQEPYKSLQACQTLTEKLAAAETHWGACQQQLKQATEAYNTYVHGPKPQAPEPARDVLGNVKQASALEFAMGTALGQRLNDVVAPTKSPSELMEKQVDELGSPEVEADLRKAKVQSMLTDYLANDNVISGYDPQEVLSAYNELSQISPRASDNPGIMRAMLRQRLAQGQLAPFDVEQLTGIEKSLSQSQRSSGGVLGDERSRVLG